VAGTTERISNGPDGSQGDNASSRPFISPGGGYVAFISAASNLLSGDVNDTLNIYVYNRIDYQIPEFNVTGQITLDDNTPLQVVTVSTGDRQSITNANGQYILSGLAPGQYTLTPTLSGYIFTPPFLEVEISSSDIIGQDFFAAAEEHNYSVFVPCVFNQGY
jgi:hypothetical protein